MKCGCGGVIFHGFLIPPPGLHISHHPHVVFHHVIQQPERNGLNPNTINVPKKAKAEYSTIHYIMVVLYII